MRGSKIPMQELWLKMGGGRIREGGRNSGILWYIPHTSVCVCVCAHIRVHTHAHRHTLTHTQTHTHNHTQRILNSETYYPVDSILSFRA